MARRSINEGDSRGSVGIVGIQATGTDVDEGSLIHKIAFYSFRHRRRRRSPRHSDGMTADEHLPLALDRYKAKQIDFAIVSGKHE